MKRKSPALAAGLFCFFLRVGPGSPCQACSPFTLLFVFRQSGAALMLHRREKGIEVGVENAQRRELDGSRQAGRERREFTSRYCAGSQGG